jgi:hypothetical protein
MTALLMSNRVDDPAYAMTKRLFREEAMIVGPSTGAIVHAATELGLPRDGVMVAISPDGGFNMQLFADILEMRNLNIEVDNMTSESVYQLPEGLSQDLEQLRQLTRQFQKGEISAARYQAFRVPCGIYEQRKPGIHAPRQQRRHPVSCR